MQIQRSHCQIHILIAVLCFAVFSFSFSVASACSIPNLLIVLDRSCSMGDNNDQKWNDAVKAIKTITNGYKGKLLFGLETFGDFAQVDYGLDQCQKDGAQCVSNLQTTLSAIFPDGGTSFTLALQTAESHIKKAKKKDKISTRRNNILFVTDGTASCPKKQVELLRLLLQVKTYVVGFGSGVNAGCLNQLADEGGTAKTGAIRYFQASSGSDLDAAMQSIADAATKEVCNGLDDDCDGQVDEGLVRECHSPCEKGVETCTQGAWSTCSAKQPQKEVCDQVDNDCDGVVDEDFTQKNKACSVGKGVCNRVGLWVCSQDKSTLECSIVPGQPTLEICDGKDNDCDGQVDESLMQDCQTICGKGTEVCEHGTWVRCTAKKPTTEVCDDKDNDCDGQIDEDFGNKGTSCQSGIGECQQQGVFRCAIDLKKTVCDAKPTPPSQEKCDGKDNDCDGKTDEDFGDKGKACTSGVGECQQQGVLVCSKDGTKTDCSVSGGKPVQERCDGKDNDCDGKLDEDLQRDCYTGAKATLGKGVCRQGIQLCKVGLWQRCQGEKRPSKEACDGKDNDCDGQVDEELSEVCRSVCGVGSTICIFGTWSSCSAPEKQQELCDGHDNDCDGKSDNQAICPSGSVCIAGRCQETCVFECSGGRVCVKGVCQGDPCQGISCSTGLVCVARKCISLCSLVQCPSHQVCSNGHCVARDCYLLGCPSDQVCFQGVCIKDACQGVTCPNPEGMHCFQGKCRRNCEVVSCQAKEICVQGECKPDPAFTGDCELVSCPQGQVCVEGKCQRPPCLRKSCPQGRICKHGLCVDDPCLTTRCFLGAACIQGKCLSTASGKEHVKENSSPFLDGGTVQVDGDGSGGTNSLGREHRFQETATTGCHCSSQIKPFFPWSMTFAFLVFLLVWRKK